MVGSMVYCSFASMFIAQAYNIHLSFHRVDGANVNVDAGLERDCGRTALVALVVLAAAIRSWHIPVAGILLLMGIDHFLDMGRSAINVLGNGIATAMLSQNEGLLTDEEAQPDWEVEKAEA
ncbi:cation:dicarboxylase symporter family transporter [Klebsiella pneumoniae]|nr:cation:dicarboxylase symporter family transporter [Klebsiella pneumoniae]